VAPSSSGANIIMTGASEAEPRRGLLRFAPIALLVITALAAYQTGALSHITPQSIAEHHAQLERFVGEWPIVALCFYIGVYAALTGACLPVALVLNLAAGIYFGTLEAGLATVAASTIGATATYASARSALAPWLRDRAQSSPQFKKALRNVERDAFAFIVASRLLPLFPSSVATVAAGVSGTPLRTFALATFLGAIPASFVYSALGAGLEGGMMAWNGSLWGLLSDPGLRGPLVALVALGAAAPIVWACWRMRAARAAV
jgi:uncharacterized membrane protein YdjX (TVP38/TMEM64 family)